MIKNYFVVSIFNYGYSNGNLFVHFKYLCRLSNSNGFSSSSCRDGGHGIINILLLLIIDFCSFACFGHQKRKCFVLHIHNYKMKIPSDHVSEDYDLDDCVQ